VPDSSLVIQKQDNLINNATQYKPRHTTAVRNNIRGREKVEMTKLIVGAIGVCTTVTLNRNFTLTFLF
jgi:hypothetical protein